MFFKHIRIWLNLFAIGFLLLPQIVFSSSISLLPFNPTVGVGGLVNIGVYADIDTSDAIIGFGFDSVMSGSGSLDFVKFDDGDFFADDLDNLAPFSDADGIRGASGGSLIVGLSLSRNVPLGTLTYRATGIGSVFLSLSADDLGFTEGLIPENPARPNFLPTIYGANVNISNVPLPPSLGLMLIGLLGIWATKKKDGLEP